MDIKYIKLGDIIKNEREKKGFTQSQLGMLANISEAEISRIERGKRKLLTAINLINICKVLDIDVIDILKVIGVYNENVKTFNLVLTKTIQKKVKINAKNEEEIIKIIENYLLGNDYIYADTDESVDIDIEEKSNKFTVENGKNDCKSYKLSCPYCGNYFFEG